MNARTVQVQDVSIAGRTDMGRQGVTHLPSRQRAGGVLSLPALILATTLVCALVFACRKEDPGHALPVGTAPVLASHGPLKAGTPAPPLGLEQVLQAPDGTKVSWESLRGKAVVLEFWATWCGPCVAAIPHLNELAQKFADRPVQFIAITAERPDVVARFVKKKPIRGWIGLDTDESMYRDYGVEGIPLTILVDAQGRLAGFTYPTGLTEQVLTDLLAGRAVVRVE